MVELFVPMSVNAMDDPKLVRAGAFAELVFYRSTQLAKRLASDGHIDRTHLPHLCRGLRGPYSKHTDPLVNEGLWVREGDGFRIASFLKRNKSRAQLDAQRDTKAAAGAKGNHVKHHVEQGRYVASCEWCLAECDDTGSHSARDGSRHSEVKSEGSEVDTSHDNDRSGTRPAGPSSPDAIRSLALSVAETLTRRREATGWRPDATHDAYVGGIANTIAAEKRRELIDVLRAADRDHARAVDLYLEQHHAEPQPAARVIPLGDRTNEHAGCTLCDGDELVVDEPGPDAKDPSWRARMKPCPGPVFARDAVVSQLPTPQRQEAL
jgi:hypothetical protein